MKYLRLWSVCMVAAFAALWGCSGGYSKNPPPAKAPRMEIVTVKGECGGDNVGPDIRVEGGDVVFSGSFWTPDPCFTVVGDMEIKKNNIRITLSTKPDGSEVCIKCVGSVNYTGKVTGLKPGGYTVSIHGGMMEKMLAQKKVKIAKAEIKKN